MDDEAVHEHSGEQTRGESGDPPESRRRGRPRQPDADRRIIDAALDVYGEVGWAGFTMDAVARRAGVGKSTVYLRWPVKDSLLLDAVGLSSSDLGVGSDTGTLEGDLCELAVGLFEYFDSAAGWAALRVTIDSAAAPNRVETLSAAGIDGQVSQVERVLERAAGRAGGRFDGDLPRAVASSIYGAVVMQILAARRDGSGLTRSDVEARATALVKLVLRGVGDALS